MTDNAAGQGEVFIAFARPWYQAVRETYVVGGYTTEAAATQAAEEEANSRGGKYEPEVLRVPVQVTVNNQSFEDDPDDALEPQAVRVPEREQRDALYRQLIALADTQRVRAFEALAARDAQVAALTAALDAVSALAGALPPEVAAQVAAAREARPGLPLGWLGLVNVEKGSRRLRVMGAPDLNEAGEWVVRVLDLNALGEARVEPVQLTLSEFAALV